MAECWLHMPNFADDSWLDLLEFTGFSNQSDDSLTSAIMNFKSPQHPCYKNRDPKSQLNPTLKCNLKYIKMDVASIPDGYPYALHAIEALNYGQNADIGTPGDAYIDLELNAHALYAKLEVTWAKWPGPEADLSQQLVHPHLLNDDNRGRFVSLLPEKGVEWVSRRTIIYRQDPETPRSAETLIKQHLVDRGLVSRGRFVRKSQAASSIDITSSSESESEFGFESGAEPAPKFTSDSGLDGIRPSKRARRIASVSRPDHIQTKLEKELVALQADEELKQLKTKKNQLMAALGCQHSSTLPSEVLQGLEKHYLSAEAKQDIPDLKTQIKQVKDALRAMEARRQAAEKQVAEYKQKNNLL
ncbi:hypothetical protein R3P38DRAFT_2851792 [Favolaschia claudopus]|uniref:Uncharacterized protein n=1 Tax=Favolaschia claudopus TaxID=2862362 RepID=A0AAW0DR44_9AGAR